MNNGRIKLPFWKRTMDILISGTLLTILLPFLGLIALLIYIESPGPVIYSSQRVGQGFKIFKFYKFRSMVMNADQVLKNLDNLYELEESEDQEFDIKTQPNTTYLLGDDGFIDAYEHELDVLKKVNKPYFKIENDPRVTRMGRFIRKTSIDELPQLFNVLKGDMSIVGNRPIPVYEAENLTCDDTIGRFLGPSGITGLWQVSATKDSAGSEDERKAYDVSYASNYNFIQDIKILARTFPAVFQKINV